MIYWVKDVTSEKQKDYFLEQKLSSFVGNPVQDNF